MSEARGSAAADAEGDHEGRNVAIACQGGGSHTAFTAGVLRGLLADWPEEDRIVGLSGTSGGAFCALVTWYSLVTDGPEAAHDALKAFWTDLSASDPLDAVTNNWLVWGSRVRSSGAAFPEFSPYDVPGTGLGKRRLLETIQRYVDFDAVATLSDADAPRLVVGTVDINGGEFETFVDSEVTPDAVLASAAVPDLFEAVEIHGHWHWDGLFSQNPPINDLLDVAADRKPDEIWVIQINPQRRDGEPQSLEQIADRRNELAGNLSLNQELSFINRVNQWIADGELSSERYRPITVRRLELDKELHCSTKLDRSPRFIHELMADGERRASELYADHCIDHTRR